MKTARAFTLVEILIVMVILGIMAAIAVPRFSTASATARASMLMDDLRILRMQVEVFKAQHRGVAPGYPDCDTSQAADANVLAAQMTLASNESGQTAIPGTDGYRYGPYFREMPINPVNGKATVKLLADGEPMPAQADDLYGWIYQPSTLSLKADCPGADETGKQFIDY